MIVPTTTSLPPLQQTPKQIDGEELQRFQQTIAAHHQAGTSLQQIALRTGWSRSQVHRMVQKAARGEVAARLYRIKIRPDDAITEMRQAGYEPLEPYPGSVSRPWSVRCRTCLAPRRLTLSRIRDGWHCRHRVGTLTPTAATAKLHQAGFEPLEPYPGDLASPGRYAAAPVTNAAAPPSATSAPATAAPTPSHSPPSLSAPWRPSVWMSPRKTPRAPGSTPSRKPSSVPTRPAGVSTRSPSTPPGHEAPSTASSTPPQPADPSSHYARAPPPAKPYSPGKSPPGRPPATRTSSTASPAVSPTATMGR